MTLNRQFTKVYDRPRKPLADQPFGRALQHFAELVDAVDEVVVQDVRFALTGEQSTEAPADSGTIKKEKHMLLTALVHDAELREYTNKKNEKVTVQGYTLIDQADDGPRMKQMIEFQPSENVPQLEMGSIIEIDVTEIQSVFSGRPRIRGTVRKSSV